MFHFWIYPLLFLTGLAAGFVDSIAGGGGLITLPVLLNLGLQPQDALGTNKLQAIFGSGSATWLYGRAGLIDPKACVSGILFTAAGAVAGGYAVLLLDPGLLKRFIPFLLIAIALYTLLQPRLGEADIHPRMPARIFYPAFGLILGFYDGFLGPGTGTFWAMAYMLGLGFNLMRATAYTKVMNLTSNAASLGLFLCTNHVLLAGGLSMGLGQVAGARLGAKTVLKRGTKFIRPIFTSVVLAITAKLLFENFAKRQ